MDTDRRLAAALAEHRAGRLADAERLYRGILDDAPRHAGALHLLGVLTYQTGRIREALGLIGDALSMRPEVAEYHANHSLALQAMGSVREAAAGYRRALALRPDYPEALSNLGTAAQDLGLALEALTHYRRALALNAAYPQALVNLGTALRAVDQYVEAEGALREALRLDPANHEALSNLGVVLKETGRAEEAEATLIAVLNHQPADAETLTNLALLREAQGRRTEAEALYRKALDHQPGHRLAQWNLGLLLLGRGALGEGYALAEARLALGRVSAARALPMPRWRGEPLQGRRILVWREQGLGDELLHAGIIADLALSAGTVIVESDRRLIGLLARSLPGVEVRGETVGADGAERMTASDADFHVPIASLPRALRPTFATYSPGPGWLRPDPERVALWAGRLAALGPGLRVGICWRSRVMSGERRGAYTSLEQWAPLFALPGLLVVNLQYDATETELRSAPLRRWHDTDLMNDLEAAAALTAGLDLVISVASSVAEMAGALGVPVWRLTGPFDWSMLGTACRPACPTMRVWRAGPGEGPADLLPRVAGELRRLAVGTDRLRRLLGQARAHHVAGRGEEAERAYIAVLSVDSDDAEALHGYGRLGLEAGRADLAAETIGRAVARHGNDPERWRDLAVAHAALVAAHSAAGRLDAAAFVRWRHIQLDPAAADAFAGLADLRRSQGRDQAAQRAARRARVLRTGRADDPPVAAPPHPPVTAAEALPRAVRLHEAGRFDEADALYAAILDSAPQHADALHLRGLIACQTGRFADAVELIGHAVAQGGRVADHHANLAYALQTLGRAAEAEVAARRALRLNPSHPEAANTLGNALSAQRRWEEAVRAYREALRRRPGYLEAEGNLGVALEALGRAAESEPHLRRALASIPTMAEAALALGRALLALNRTAEAVPFLRDAVRRRPAHAPAWGALANTGGPLAVARWKQALTLEPADAAGWNGAGLALQAAECLDAAGVAFARSVRLDPGMSGPLTNLGNLRRLQGRPADAAVCHRRVLERFPRDATARTNLALALQDLGRVGDAEAEFDRALQNDPTQALARFNRGVLRLVQGRVGEGWEDYATRFESPQLFAPRRFSIPAWTEGSPAGRRILVWREQGLGDELMFSSCYPDLIAQAGGVILECDRRLVPLFTRSFPGTIVRAPTADPRDADLQVPAGTLPRLLRPDISAFPPRAGWLVPDPHRTAVLRDRVAALGPGLAVGITWTSRRADATRQAAYTCLDDWAPVFALAGLCLVSLQYDDREEEIAAAERRHGVRIHRFPDLDLMNDLDGAAALIAALDLVLTVASSVGEMAGALGVPAWRLGGRDWTQLGTAARPWFPTQRLVHPSPGSGMASAVRRAAALLGNLRR